MSDFPPADNSRQPIVGVVPMAGKATRLPGLPCSKEIFPLGSGHSDSPETHPTAVCEGLLGQMQTAGVQDVYIVIRDGKWDIPAYLGDGSRLGLNLAYLMMGRPFGTPYSIDQAYPFVREHRVALGFPDMCFDQSPIFSTLLAHQEASGADLVLGVFPADRPQKVDMLELDADYRIQQLVIKPTTTTLQLTWGVAIWTPVFTAFMHTWLAAHSHTADHSPEVYVGDVVRAALEAGLDVQGVPVSTQPFIDIGTWEDLERVAERKP